jgi:serine/threonine protein kinase
MAAIPKRCHKQSNIVTGSASTCREKLPRGERFMDRHDCVTEVDLRAFQLGELPDRLGALVSEHLAVCPACAARADGFDTIVDPYILQMRQAVGQSSSVGRSAPPAAAMNCQARRPEIRSESAAFPRQFGAYELLGELGRGGMSVVYLARQQRPARTVALKMILAGVHAGIERRTRFLAEADAIGRLQHPHIVEIYEVGEHDGQLYLALEWLDAGSLASHLAGQAQDPVASAVLLEKLARAIHYAHECGIVHRDLKPSNILLQKATPGAAGSLQEFVPKIADFGLAKQEDVSLTATNAMVGTPAYMAPEQAAGDKRLVGPPCDVYALGAILYELLTGRPPFQGNTVLETLDQARSSEPTPPEHLQARVHPDLSSICLKCLHKEPERRYRSALELAEDLGRFLAGTPTRARRVGSLERTWRWSRRNPMLAATITTVALLLIIIAVGASLLSLNLHSALTVSEEKTVLAQNAQRQATDHLWEAYLAEARSNRLSGRIGQRLQSLAAIRKAQQLPTPTGHSIDELRNEAIAALVLPDMELTKVFAPLSEEINWWAMAPDLDRFVVVHRDGDVQIRRVKDDTVIAPLPSLGPVQWRGVSFSPDGRYVQQLTRSAHVLWDVQGPTPVEKIKMEAPATHEHNVAFSADSKRVFFVDTKGFILVHDTASGKELHRWHPGMPAHRLACHPERDELAISGGGIVRVFDIATGASRLQINHDAFVYWIAWHPNGKLLATGCDDLKIRMWDGVTGALARQPFTHVSPGMVFQFSHSGDYLAGADWSGPMQVWDTRFGQKIFALSGSLAWFSPDDRHLGVSSDPRQIWRVHSSPELVRLALPFPETRSRFNGLHAGTDRRFFIASTFDGWLLIDWMTGREVALVPMPMRHRVFAQEGAQALLSNGNRGIWRWPVRAEADANRLHIGPPELVTVHGNDHIHGASQDCSVIAIPRHGTGAMLWERDNGKKILGPLEDNRECAVSPDGRWVAASNFGNIGSGISVTIWDTRTGNAKKEFRLGPNGKAAFSPDNRWLLTRAREKSQLWSVGDWKEGPDLHDDGGPYGHFAFSADSKTLALSGPFSQIRLLEISTGREFARLTVPEETKLFPYLFSPDGTHLAAIGLQSQLLYLWDLRAIRAGLKELDLDWDQPAYPPAAPVTAPPHVDFDLGDLGRPPAE